MTMNEYFYGRNYDTERTLSEDGFNDGMINYIHENETKKADRSGRTSFFRGFFTRSGRETPAYQG